MKLRILVPIAVIGFALGAALTADWTPEKTRNTRLIEIATAVCVPFVRDGSATPPADLGLHRLADSLTARRWLDLKSRSFLELSKRRCVIELHDENALSRSASFALLEPLSELRATQFPQLSQQATTDALGDPLFVIAWIGEHPETLEPWGVYLAGNDHPDNRAAGYSAISFLRPLNATIPLPTSTD